MSFIISALALREFIVKLRTTTDEFSPGMSHCRHRCHPTSGRRPGSLGLLNSHLTMKTHVARVARSCFHLRRLLSIRRSPGCDVTTRLTSALVIWRLYHRDHCNSVLTHSPVATLAPLQRVLNTAVRLAHDFGPRGNVVTQLEIYYSNTVF